MTFEHEQQRVAEARQDSAAFAELYDFYFPRVYRYVSARVGRQQDTEDLVSEIFLKAVANLDDFQWRHAGSFAAWLFRIAHNHIRNFYRDRDQRQAFVALDEVPAIRATTLLPDDLLLRKELFAQLYRLIGTLSPRREEVITLRFFAGLRNQEIAEVLGLDERTVASHLSRGLAQLYTLYRDEVARAREGVA